MKVCFDFSNNLYFLSKLFQYVILQRLLNIHFQDSKQRDLLFLHCFSITYLLYVAVTCRLMVFLFILWRVTRIIQCFSHWLGHASELLIDSIFHFNCCVMSDSGPVVTYMNLLKEYYLSHRKNMTTQLWSTFFCKS